MKKIIYIIIICCMCVKPLFSQGWVQDKKAVYSFGLGGSQSLFVPFNVYPVSHTGNMAFSINFSGEYKVQRFIGIGWQTGINIFPVGYYRRNDGIYYTSAVIGIPMGFKMNFHILEAANAKVKDKLDVYAGFNVGGGPAFVTGPQRGAYGFIYVGPQVGVRYWFSRVALFGELGWGENIANIGISF